MDWVQEGVVVGFTDLYIRSEPCLRLLIGNNSEDNLEFI